MVGKAIGEGRTVVEDELFLVGSLRDRPLKGPVFLPERKDTGLNGGEVRFVDGRVWLIRVARHSRQGYSTRTEFRGCRFPHVAFVGRRAQFALRLGLKRPDAL